MRKFFIVIVVLLMSNIVINAQNNRFVYEYKSVKDSTEVDKVSTEMMVLDIKPEGSKFYSYETYKRDSAIKADMKRQLEMGRVTMKTNIVQGKTNYSVTKKYPEYTVSLHTKIFADSYKVSEERKLKWKILPEKEKIGEWQTQKATVDFAGRQWTAWFAEEIPFPDGPYKFYGLPGLIVKLVDAKNHHSFELKGIQKIQLSQLDESNLDNMASREMPISNAQYKKLFLENRNDPAKHLRQTLSSGNSTVKMYKDKVEVSPSDMLKTYEESQKRLIQKDNNLIEIDLLK